MIKIHLICSSCAYAFVSQSETLLIKSQQKMMIENVARFISIVLKSKFNIIFIVISCRLRFIGACQMRELMREKISHCHTQFPHVMILSILALITMEYFETSYGGCFHVYICGSTPSERKKLPRAALRRQCFMLKTSWMLSECFTNSNAI